MKIHPANLEAHFRDRSRAQEVDFGPKLIKTVGESPGHISPRNTDQATFMMKPVLKGPVAIGSADAHNKDDFMREYITAPIFKRFLYNRAPIIEMATGEHSSTLMLTSKYIDGFKSFNEYRDEQYKITNAHGFEKAIAVSIFAGDVDYRNEGNFGLIANSRGEDEVAKIDHGKAAFAFYSQERLVRHEIYNASEYFNGARECSINVEAIKAAVNQIAEVSPQEIDDIIQARIHNLKQVKFVPNQEIEYL